VQVDAWLYASHQRYFFFQQLSTAGALLQAPRPRAPSRHGLPDPARPATAATPA
jgi:hypothetical protein